ncbi:hypothetical protein ES703_16690 [subsurface metagenome]
MNAEQVILSRGLPKTGEIITTPEGCDGFYQAGWWVGQKEAPYKTRFIAKTIGGDDVVIDLATGLMWAADGNEAGCKNGAAKVWDYALWWPIITAFAGFSDWRVPNVKELMSIVDNGRQNPAIKQLPFSNTVSLGYWTSTTFLPSTDEGWIVHFAEGVVTHKDKDTSYYLRCVRGGL